MEQSQQSKHPITSVSGTQDLLSFEDQAEARKYFYLTYTKRKFLYITSVSCGTHQHRTL